MTCLRWLLLELSSAAPGTGAYSLHKGLDSFHVGAPVGVGELAGGLLGVDLGAVNLDLEVAGTLSVSLKGESERFRAEFFLHVLCGLIAVLFVASSAAVLHGNLVEAGADNFICHLCDCDLNLYYNFVFQTANMNHYNCNKYNKAKKQS